MPKRKSPGSSVKDKKLYEKLRDEGNSKKKSARIANAAAASSRTKLSRKGGKSSKYDDMTKAELYNRAKKVGVKGRSSMSKGELVKALRKS
jgi:hypothetical protein